MTTSAGPVVSVALPCHGSPPPRAERVPVVVVVEPDGFIRVFGPDHLDVRFVGLLDVLPENRTDAEAYAARALPAPHRAVAFDARFSRASYTPKPITPEEELQRVITTALVQEAQR